MIYKNFTYFKIISFLVLFSMISCYGYKKTLYFQGDQQTLDPPKLSATYILRTGDMLQIQITNPDVESHEVLTNTSTMEATSDQAYFTSYYINDSGCVELPFIGKLKVVGHTIMEVDSMITTEAKDYFSYATVDVKFASFKFLAMGNFAKPGQYFVANESCTIYEAIAMANDGGLYSDNETAQLIRTLEDGSKKVYHLNLTDYSTFSSEVYYIQPNDIIYIKAQKAKIDKLNFAYVSLGMSALLLLTTLVLRLK